jgi:hypothetical protein
VMLLVAVAASPCLLELVVRQRPAFEALLQALEQADPRRLTAPVLRRPEREPTLRLAGERCPHRARIEPKQGEVDRQGRVAVCRQGEVVVAFGEMPVLGGKGLSA